MSNLANNGSLRIINDYIVENSLFDAHNMNIYGNELGYYTPTYGNDFITIIGNNRKIIYTVKYDEYNIFVFTERFYNEKSILNIYHTVKENNNDDIISVLIKTIVTDYDTIKDFKCVIEKINNHYLFYYVSNNSELKYFKYNEKLRGGNEYKTEHFLNDSYIIPDYHVYTNNIAGLTETAFSIFNNNGNLREGIYIYVCRIVHKSGVTSNYEVISSPSIIKNNGSNKITISIKHDNEYDYADSYFELYRLAYFDEYATPECSHLINIDIPVANEAGIVSVFYSDSVYTKILRAVAFDEFLLTRDIIKPKTLELVNNRLILGNIQKTTDTRPFPIGYFLSHPYRQNSYTTKCVDLITNTNYDDSYLSSNNNNLLVTQQFRYECINDDDYFYKSNSSTYGNTGINVDIEYVDTDIALKSGESSASIYFSDLVQYCLMPNEKYLLFIDVLYNGVWTEPYFIGMIKIPPSVHNQNSIVCKMPKITIKDDDFNHRYRIYYSTDFSTIVDNAYLFNGHLQKEVASSLLKYKINTDMRIGIGTESPFLFAVYSPNLYINDASPSLSHFSPQYYMPIQDYLNDFIYYTNEPVTTNLINYTNIDIHEYKNATEKSGLIISNYHILANDNIGRIGYIKTNTVLLKTSHSNFEERTIYGAIYKYSVIEMNSASYYNTTMNNNLKLKSFHRTSLQLNNINIAILQGGDCYLGTFSYLMAYTSKVDEKYRALMLPMISRVNPNTFINRPFINITHSSNDGINARSLYPFDLEAEFPNGGLLAINRLWNRTDFLINTTITPKLDIKTVDESNYIYWSDASLGISEVNEKLIFRPLSKMQLNKIHGAVTDLKYVSSLIIFQKSGISYTMVNQERLLSAQNGNIVAGVSSLLSEPQIISSNSSKDINTDVIVLDNIVVYLDSISKSISLLGNNGVDKLESVLGVQNLLRTIIDENTIVKFGHNKLYNQLQVTLYNKNRSTNLNQRDITFVKIDIPNKYESAYISNTYPDSISFHKVFSLNNIVYMNGYNLKITGYNEFELLDYTPPFPNNLYLDISKYTKSTGLLSFVIDITDMKIISFNDFHSNGYFTLGETFYNIVDNNIYVNNKKDSNQINGIDFSYSISPVFLTHKFVKNSLHIIIDNIDTANKLLTRNIKFPYESLSIVTNIGITKSIPIIVRDDKRIGYDKNNTILLFDGSYINKDSKFANTIRDKNTYKIFASGLASRLLNIHEGIDNSFKDRFIYKYLNGDYMIINMYGKKTTDTANHIVKQIWL